jgi:Flp pilus assembly protein TadB
MQYRFTLSFVYVFWVRSAGRNEKQGGRKQQVLMRRERKGQENALFCCFKHWQAYFSASAERLLCPTTRSALAASLGLLLLLVLFLLRVHLWTACSLAFSFTAFVVLAGAIVVVVQGRLKRK